MPPQANVFEFLDNSTLGKEMDERLTNLFRGKTIDQLAVYIDPPHVTMRLIEKVHIYDDIISSRTLETIDELLFD